MHDLWIAFFALSLGWSMRGTVAQKFCLRCKVRRIAWRYTLWAIPHVLIPAWQFGGHAMKKFSWLAKPISAMLAIPTALTLGPLAMSFLDDIGLQYLWSKYSPMLKERINLYGNRKKVEDVPGPGVREGKPGGR